MLARSVRPEPFLDPDDPLSRLETGDLPRDCSNSAVFKRNERVRFSVPTHLPQLLVEIGRVRLRWLVRLCIVHFKVPLKKHRPKKFLQFCKKRIESA